MAEIFIMKAGDTLPALEAVLSDGAGHNVDLTIVEEVWLHLQAVGTTDAPEVLASEIVDAAEGPEPFPCVVRYTWPGPQTLLPGLYYGEWEIHWPSGDVETFPNDGYFVLQVSAQLA